MVFNIQMIPVGGTKDGMVRFISFPGVVNDSGNISRLRAV